MSLSHVSQLLPGKTIFRDTNGAIWIVESTCDVPTVAMRRLYPDAPGGEAIRLSGAVGCRLFEAFTELVPKENP